MSRRDGGVLVALRHRQRYFSYIRMWRHIAVQADWKKEVRLMIELPRHKHFNVPLQAPFLQSFWETRHLYHAMGIIKQPKDNL